MNTEMNQLDNQEFVFGDLDSLQEQVALKNSAQNNEKEPELTGEIVREWDDLSRDNLDLLDAFDEQTKRENELSQEWYDKEAKEDEYQKFLEKLEPDEIQCRVQEKTQEEIDLKYSLAKMKQDLDFNSQTQEEKQEVDLIYPAQKRGFLNETLEVVYKGITPNIKESLSILERLDEVESQIAKKEKELNANSEQNKDSSSPSKTILDSEIDEALQKQQQEQQELHQKELESLQKEKETLEKNFEASIENLIKQGDVKDLLKNLQTLDKAFAEFLKKTKEECDLLAKQRIEKLELALQSNSVKEVVSEFVKELHTNCKEVKEQSKELESQKECFEALQKQQQKCLKGDEKSMSEARFDLERNLVWLNENHPTFKENYPKFYKELERTLKEPQQQKQKQQENTRQRSA
ncbi:hypothetical protein [Helicobacter sp. UBA3407]|uniref:hypothetical protein n=1 Tax=Helicobacter TaxID=209 RepID=UPI002603F183|nr:hypothetical protein [Helicobacter sp. UBA3407]